MCEILKYPRTRHILDSALQPGDEDLERETFAAIAGRHLVIEEKVDGANSAISFDSEGKLLLQSRGHYLTGGARERHFALFKSWASTIAGRLQPVLNDRYVVYGEWLFAKHTIFYDALPHYFLEFDVFDRSDGAFLSTDRRQNLLRDLPLCSVPILHDGLVETPDDVVALVGRSGFKSGRWLETLKAMAAEKPHRIDMVIRQTDPSDLMEGLYIKVEEAGRVEARYKYVRPDFMTTVINSESHWQSRPILKNTLVSGSIMDML